MGFADLAGNKVPKKDDLIIMDMFPKGTVLLWYGSSVPSGWAICDGNNGTPNLMDRFP